MNSEHIPIEALEKLMLEKSFSELSEQEKEFTLSYLASPAEYDDIRNTLLQIRNVFSEDKCNLKMPFAGKEELMEKFRHQRTLNHQVPSAKIVKYRWMWVAAASLLLIISLIIINHQHDALKNHREIALQSDLPEQHAPASEQLQNELSVNIATEETVSEVQEFENSNSVIEHNTTILSDEVEETKHAVGKEELNKSNEQPLPFTSSAIETKNLPPTVSVADETMTMEYRESESLQPTTKKDYEVKQEKSTQNTLKALMNTTEKKRVIDEQRKAAIRKAFLFTDI